jgi:hypothetical protein
MRSKGLECVDGSPTLESGGSKGGCGDGGPAEVVARAGRGSEVVREHCVPPEMDMVTIDASLMYTSRSIASCVMGLCGPSVSHQSGSETKRRLMGHT